MLNNGPLSILVNFGLAKVFGKYCADFAFIRFVAVAAF